MNPFRPILAVLSISIGLLPAFARQTAPPDGHWEGAISLPATRLAIRVDLGQTNGAWSGSIDIPAQSLRNFKLGGVSVEDSTVRFALPGVPGSPSFAGSLAADGGSIDGNFSQSGQTFPFRIERMAPSVSAAGQPSGKGLPGKGLAGFWQGAFKPAPAVELRLALEITNASGGKMDGVLISLDQGNSRIPLTSITETDGAVRLGIDAIQGAFDGTFDAEGSEISGEWRQGGRKMPLTFKRIPRSAALNRPQEPRKPYPYAELEARIENTAAGVTLAGTLTLPPGAGPHPVVVLITGSGPQDRDEYILGHRPFLVLADHLARAGIAVLRYDDRGVARSTGDFGAATHQDFTEDALAAVNWLKTRAEIDPGRIGLVGHSESGVVAPLAAVRQPEDVAFIVLLAGVGVPMTDLLVRQGTDLGRVAGLDEKNLAKTADAQREAYSRLMQASSRADAEKLMRETGAAQAAGYTPAQRESMGLTDAMIEQQARTAASPWFRRLIAYDPRPTLRLVKCPVLAINGEKDLQVAAKDNLDAIAAALNSGGNSRVKVIEFPGLNHLFQTCATGAIGEYGQIEETFSPAALKAVSHWISEQAVPGR